MKSNKDKGEWLRWMKRPPKKEKKVESSDDDKIVEKVLINGDHDLFVELCAAEEKIRELRLENKALKEKYEQQARYGSYSLSQTAYGLGAFTTTIGIDDLYATTPTVRGTNGGR